MGKPRTPNPTEGEGISKVAYWQLKEKVREVGKCIGFENGESYEEDKMLELDQMYADYFGVKDQEAQDEKMATLTEVLRKAEKSIENWITNEYDDVLRGRMKETLAEIHRKVEP